MKLLLLNVIAAAIACSSLGFKTATTGETTKVGEKATEEVADTPRLAPQRQLDITKYLDGSSNTTGSEDDGDDGDGEDNNDGNDLDLSIHSNFKDLDHEYSINPDLINERVIDKPIFHDPIFVPDPGTGGGSANADNSYSEKATNNDCANDYVDNSEMVPNNGPIAGHLVKHADYQQNLYALSSIDVDWFRFYIEEKREITFSFTASSNSFYCQLYRFNTNDRCCIENGQRNHSILYSIRNNSNPSSYTAILNPGTYFFRVSSDDIQSIQSTNGSYKITYSTNLADTGVPYFDLTKEALGNEKVIVWENDAIPFGGYHWVQDKVSLCRYSLNGPTQAWGGYLDPIYMTNKNWTPYSQYYFSLEDYTRLNSVLYVTGKNNLKTVKTLANTLKKQISNEAYNKHIRSLKYQVESCVYDTAEMLFKIAIKAVVTYVGGQAAGEALDKIFTYVENADTAVSMLKAFSFALDEQHFVSDADMGIYMQKLESTCDEMIKHYSTTNYILRIPRYSYLFHNDPVNCLPEVRWISTLFLPSPFTYEDDEDDDYYYFKVRKGTTVTRVQRMRGDSREFMGTISVFNSIKTFWWEHANPVVVDSDPAGDNQSLLEYAIRKRLDNQYYLNVTNPGNMEHLVTVNTTDVSPEQGQYFNLKADSYTYELVGKYSPYQVCLEDRTYAFVRENWSNKVRKVTYSNGDTFLEDPYEFGMDYLKLSIVKKEGTVWTIRIRNLTTTNLKIYYNSKMCFSNDANNWSGLNHVTETYVCYNRYVDVEIQENGWATSIVASYIKDGKRYISRGAWLNSETKALSYRTNCKNA